MEDVRVKRLTKMTSGESFDSNAVEANGIHLEIMEPTLIVLSIPKNRFFSNTFAEIDVGLINSTATPFYLNPNDTLIPEIFTSDGQALQGQIATDESVCRLQNNIPLQSGFGFKLTQFLSKIARSFFNSEATEFDPRLVDSGQGIQVTLTLRLIWRNNLLQLQVINSPSYLPIVFSLLDKSWFFNALQPGTYQLRFIWGNPGENERDYNQETREVMGAVQLATQFVNLRLIEPVRDDNSAVEVEGIRFQTLLPEQVLSLADKKRDAAIPVQIGIRITNNTQSLVRLNLFATLIPKLVRDDGQVLKGCYARLRTLRCKESDFPLVVPGESVTFFPNARLSYFKREPFILTIAAGDGGYWSFNTINLGTYQIQFTYNNKDTVVTMRGREMTDAKRIENLWMGIVSMPFVEFRLV